MRENYYSRFLCTFTIGLIGGLKKTASGKEDPTHFVNWLYLAGFESEQVDLETLRRGNLAFDNIEWLHKIRKARDAVRKISDRSNVVPAVKPLDQYDGLLARLKEEEVSKGHRDFANKMKLALIELDKIRTRQMRINMDYVNELVKVAPKPDDIDGTVKFCLPTEDEIQKMTPKVEFQANAKYINLVFDDARIKFITLVVDDPRIKYLEPVHERDNSGFGYAGFRYGNILNSVHVINHKGTFILKNGNHRALALLKANHTFLPCVLTDVTDELVTKSFPRSLIMSEKSPFLSDFNTDAAILVPRRKTRFKIIIRAEVKKEPI